MKTKWEMWSGYGAMRRAQQVPNVSDGDAVDHEVWSNSSHFLLQNFFSKVLVVVEAQAKLQLISEAEAKWQENVVELFNNGKEPPILDLGDIPSKPADVQETFRVKMLEYWASNPNALRYSTPVEPMNSGIFTRKFLLKTDHNLPFRCFGCFAIL